MPCYSERVTTQILENIPDINLLAKGLILMGFKVTVPSANKFVFQGVDKTTGLYQSGQYLNEGGKLISSDGLDLEVLKKYVAKANIISQVEKNQQDKYKATKISVKWTGEFDFVITKK